MKALVVIALTTRPRRFLVWAGMGGLLLLSAVVLMWWRSAADRVAVLVIEENNGAILAASPERVPSPRLVTLEGPTEEARDGGTTGMSLRLDPTLVPPGVKARVVVYHSVSSGLDLVADRAWGIPTLPFSVPVAAPVDLRGTSSGGSAANPVQNERRLVPAEITVVRVGRQGVLELRVRGSDIRLAPGEQWVEGRLRRGGAEESVPPDQWDTTVETALNRGEPITVLRISHLGWIPRRALLSGGEVTAARIGLN